MSLRGQLKEKVRELPDKPGCYIMRDRRGQIIYVGKAASLRKRVQSYFRHGTLRSADPKLRGLINSIDDIEVIVLKNEATAVLTEGRLIKAYRPRYNTFFKDDKRFLMVRLDMSQAFPRFQLCRIQRNDNSLYFGPYASSMAARVALEFVEKGFGVRKCRARLPDASDHKHCINDIVRFCSAPCLGRVSAGQYHARVNEACA
ncbi:GIY-YIG nuclease family protein, partial [Verrucomicrobiota bacterium]